MERRDLLTQQRIQKRSQYHSRQNSVSLSFSGEIQRFYRVRNSRKDARLRSTRSATHDAIPKRVFPSFAFACSQGTAQVSGIWDVQLNPWKAGFCADTRLRYDPVSLADLQRHNSCCAARIEVLWGYSPVPRSVFLKPRQLS